MKIALKISMILAFAWWIFFLILQWRVTGDARMTTEHLSLLANVKLLVALALYTAWRVTP